MDTGNADYRYSLACLLIPRYAPELATWYQQRYGRAIPGTHFEVLNVHAGMTAAPPESPQFQNQTTDTDNQQGCEKFHTLESHYPAPKSLRPLSADEVQAVQAAIERYWTATRHRFEHVADWYTNALGIIRMEYPAMPPELVTWLQQRTGYTPPEAAPAPAAATIPPNAIAMDPEFCRTGIALGYDTETLCWHVWRDSAAGRGWLHLKDTAKALRRCGVEMDARTRRAVVAAGTGIFWTVDKRTKRLYLTGYKPLAKKLTKIARDTVPDVVKTNQPGQQPVYIDTRGNATDWTSRCLAAWYGETRTISRFVSTRLWQRSVPTLLAWEERAGIAKQAGTAQYAGDNPDLPPEHAYPYVTADGQQRQAWQTPNTYISPSFMEKKTGRRGVYRVRAECREVVALSDTDSGMACSVDGADSSDTVAGLHPDGIGKTYFRERKRGLSHLKRYQDWQRRHYCHLATKHLRSGDRRIYDVITPEAQTDAHELFTLRFPARQQEACRYA